MSDDADGFRAILARALGMLAASVHAEDPDDQIDIAEKHAHWILTGEPMPDPFDPGTARMLDRCTAGFKSRRK